MGVITPKKEMNFPYFNIYVSCVCLGFLLVLRFNLGLEVIANNVLEFVAVMRIGLRACNTALPSFKKCFMRLR